MSVPMVGPEYRVPASAKFVAALVAGPETTATPRMKLIPAAFCVKLPKSEVPGWQKAPAEPFDPQ